MINVAQQNSDLNFDVKRSRQYLRYNADDIFELLNNVILIYIQGGQPSENGPTVYIKTVEEHYILYRFRPSG